MAKEVKFIQLPERKKSEALDEFRLITYNFLMKDLREIVQQPHRTDFHQLIFFTHGEGEHWVDFKAEKYGPGTLIPVKAGQVQKFNHDNGTQAYLLLFTEQFIYQKSGDMDWFMTLQLFNPDYEPYAIHLQPTEANEFSILLEQIQNELAIHPEYAQEDIIKTMLRTFLLKAERAKRARSQCLGCENQDSELYSRFRKYLEENYKTSRCASEYADALTISLKKLNQITDLHTGKRAKQIIEERTLLEIKRLLVYTDLTIKEIAYSLGFSDPTNLVKFFKRFTKTTPIDFKETYRSRANFYHTKPLSNHS